MQRFFENPIRTYAKFSEKPKKFPPKYAHVRVCTCTYQGVRNDTLLKFFGYVLVLNGCYLG